jgi:hypothetical protein
MYTKGSILASQMHLKPKPRVLAKKGVILRGFGTKSKIPGHFDDFRVQNLTEEVKVSRTNLSTGVKKCGTFQSSCGTGPKIDQNSGTLRNTIVILFLSRDILLVSPYVLEFP